MWVVPAFPQKVLDAVSLTKNLELISICNLSILKVFEFAIIQLNLIFHSRPQK